MRFLTRLPDSSTAPQPPHTCQELMNKWVEIRIHEAGNQATAGSQRCPLSRGEVEQARVPRPPLSGYTRGSSAPRKGQLPSVGGQNAGEIYLPLDIEQEKDSYRVQEGWERVSHWSRARSTHCPPIHDGSVSPPHSPQQFPIPDWCDH